MFEIIGSVVGGYVVGSAINLVRGGARTRSYWNSPKGRRKIQTTRRDIRRRVKSIYWREDDLDKDWYKR